MNVTGKRKREERPGSSKKSKTALSAPQANGRKSALKSSQTKSTPAAKKISTTDKPAELKDRPALPTTSPEHITIQIVAGSYERVLHGVAARIPIQDTGPSENNAKFTDTFLFAAHSSSIRCLAISPATGSNKRLLATGSSDERVNVYSISTIPPAPTATTKTQPSSLLQTTSSSTPRNTSIGTLSHHERALTTLAFPTKTKLFSGAEDNAIAISRVRDWTLLSTIKAPVPKPLGRPSGDTASGPGDFPTGINAFAIHPSQKLMLSVSRREKAMRLWNLMTGKKAGVLSFERGLLAQVGEGMRFSLGEGRSVRWDSSGEGFVVGFERGAAVFGIDCKARAVVRAPLSFSAAAVTANAAAQGVKLQQMRVLPLDGGASVLAVSTEDGRILLFDIAVEKDGEQVKELDAANLPLCRCVAQIGGSAEGISGRIKDFDVVRVADGGLVIVAGSSDGAVRVWTLSGAEVSQITGAAGVNGNSSTASGAAAAKTNGSGSPVPQMGTLVGTLETGSRITCLGAFIMDGEGDEEEETGAVDGMDEEDSSEDSE